MMIEIVSVEQKEVTDQEVVEAVNTMTGQTWRCRMIDEKRVLQVARELNMNPDKARKLLEDARSEPAIMKRIHKYEQLAGGDRGGHNSAGAVCGAEGRNQRPT